MLVSFGFNQCALSLHEPRRLLCESADESCDFLCFTSRQNHIHSWVRIKQRKGQHFRRSELPGNQLEWRRVGYLPGVVGFNRMTPRTAGLREPFAVVGIGRERRRWQHGCGNKNPNMKRSHDPYALE